MLKIRFHFLLILCLGLFSACENEIELDIDREDQNLAIFSLFSPNSIFDFVPNFEVEVSATQSVLDNSEFRYIENAVVTIKALDIESSSERSSQTLSFSNVVDNENTIYRFDETVPEDGYMYELKVEHKDYPTITATSIVPAPTEINSIEFSEFKKSRENELPGFTRYFSTATINLENNPTISKHFHLLVWQAYGNNLVPVSIDRDLLQEQIGADATIINVENSLVYHGAHFDDRKFTGDSQELNFDISFSLSEEQNPEAIVVELRSVSKDYQNYFIEGYRLSQAGNNSFFVSADNVSNNIDNGFGVFAGYSTYHLVEPFRK